jgi:multidrug efflux system membrane fusion protein
MLVETEPSESAAPGKSRHILDILALRGLISLRGLRPLIPLFALALTSCGDKPPPAAAAAAPPVTVAHRHGLG